MAFMAGAEFDHYITNSTECVSNSETMTGALMGSFKQIFTTWPSINNYLTLTKSLQSISPVLNVCYDVSNDGYHELITYIRKFPDVQTYLKKMTLNVAFSFLEWRTITYGMKDAVAANNETGIAYWSGAAIHQLLAVNPDLKRPQEGLNVINPLAQFGVQFLNGTGMISSPEVTSFVTKYEDFNTLLNNIKTSLQS